MDAGYVVLICLVGFIALMILWGVAGISPLGLLRLTFGGDMGVNSSRLIMSSEQESRQADETDRHADRPSVSGDDLYCPRLELDRSKTAAIEVLVYNGWGAGDIRAIIKGDNGAIGLEVKAAQARLGIEAPDNRTPIANRPTDAEFAPR